jgi:hypothetical protein
MNIKLTSSQAQNLLEALEWVTEYNSHVLSDKAKSDLVTIRGKLLGQGVTTRNVK